ncbi:MAG: hypothetical protein ACP5RM_01850 [Candidatus Micrarchaeia archaeon]
MATRLITINIRKYLVEQPRTKRIRKAVKFIRQRIARLSKVSEDNVKMSRELNEYIFKRAAKSMTPVKVNVSIENNIANATLYKEVKKEQEQVQKSTKESKSAVNGKAETTKAPEKAKK